MKLRVVSGEESQTSIFEVCIIKDDTSYDGDNCDDDDGDANDGDDDVDISGIKKSTAHFRLKFSLEKSSRSHFQHQD